jgi:hypothetical protein
MCDTLEEFCDDKLIPFIIDLNKIRTTIKQKGCFNMGMLYKIDLLKKIINVYNNPENFNYILEDKIPTALPVLDNEDACSDTSDVLSISDFEFDEITEKVNNNYMKIEDDNEDSEDSEDSEDIYNNNILVEHLTVTSLEKLKYIKNNKFYDIEDIDDDDDEFDKYSCESHNYSTEEEEEEEEEEMNE